VSASGNGAVEVRSYYGRPILKQPVWKPEIPWYFFVGGMAGAAAPVAFGAGLAGNDALARRAWLLALAGVSVSPVLLITDLGRPERFYNMLRVFKVTSPMSVGSWALAGFGGATGLSAIGFRPARPVAALLGPVVSTYTAALLADTSIPVWHEARRELPLAFAASAVASAGGALALVTPAGPAGPARRLVVGGAAVEVATMITMERRLGALAEPYHQGDAGRYARAAKVLMAAGGATMAIAGRRSRAAAALAGAAVVAGAVASRWSIFRAGFQSAADPKYVVGPQRERIAAGESRGA
jgi:formate-dependent nitrite reductase membrane component NrfD